MLRHRFRRSYWYRNVAHFALVLSKHTWKYAILKLHLKLLKLHLKLLKLHWTFQNILKTLKISKIWKMFEKHMCFEFFQIFQKVFPRIPGGCIHKESDENRVLSNFYLSFGDICFWHFWVVFELCFLFNMTPYVL